MSAKQDLEKIEKAITGPKGISEQVGELAKGLEEAKKDPADARERDRDFSKVQESIEARRAELTAVKQAIATDSSGDSDRVTFQRLQAELANQEKTVVTFRGELAPVFQEQKEQKGAVTPTIKISPQMFVAPAEKLGGAGVVPLSAEKKRQAQAIAQVPVEKKSEAQSEEKEVQRQPFASSEAPAEGPEVPLTPQHETFIQRFGQALGWPNPEITRYPSNSQTPTGVRIRNSVESGGNNATITCFTSGKLDAHIPGTASQLEKENFVFESLILRRNISGKTGGDIYIRGFDDATTAKILQRCQAAGMKFNTVNGKLPSEYLNLLGQQQVQQQTQRQQPYPPPANIANSMVTRSTHGKTATPLISVDLKEPPNVKELNRDAAADKWAELFVSELPDAQKKQPINLNAPDGMDKGLLKEVIAKIHEKAAGEISIAKVNDQPLETFIVDKPPVQPG